MCTLETSLFNSMNSNARESLPTPQVECTHFNEQIALPLLVLPWPNNSWSQSQHFSNYLTAAKPDATRAAETSPIH